MFHDKFVYVENRLSLFANYKKVEEHRHFAKHILVADRPFLCVVDGEKYNPSAVFIQSNSNHYIDYKGDNPIFMMLVDETSSLSDRIDKLYLNGKNIGELPDEIYLESLKYLKGNKLKEMDEYLIHHLFDWKDGHRRIDDRIVEVINYIEEMETIPNHLFSQMAKKVSLSDSRFSHLFKEQVGVDFKNYLLTKKMEKTVMYTIIYKMSITEAAIHAGFSSSAHFATACKKHYGISLRDFINSQR